MSLRILLVFVLLLDVASAVAVVSARHRHRQLFTELNKQEKQRDQLNMEFSQLQLEQATWAESNLIDRTARERLGMVLPQAKDIVVVRR